MSKFYVHAILDSNIKFDVILGLAYKGIPIVVATAMQLLNFNSTNIPYCFTRKEKKPNGEGGLIVGQELTGKILILDDVITAGTAIKNSIKSINTKHAKISGILIALDREEIGYQQYPATQEIKKTFCCQIISLVTITDIILYLKKKNIMNSHINRIIDYKSCYGA